MSMKLKVLGCHDTVSDISIWRNHNDNGSNSNKAHIFAAAEKSNVPVDVGLPGAAETLAWTLRLGGRSSRSFGDKVSVSDLWSQFHILGFGVPCRGNYSRSQKVGTSISSWP